jgi:phosphoenolpyruvate carboxykinase (ATP)
VPAAVKGIDSRILKPRETWSDKQAFDVTAKGLVRMFQENFAKFENVVDADVRAVAMSA